MARQFAALGYDLALCARRTERLDELKKDIANDHPGVRVEVKALDVVETRPDIRTPFGIVHRPGALNPAAKSFIIQSHADLTSWNSRIAAHERAGNTLLESSLLADDELRNRRVDGCHQ